jgi:hypothetical protein
MISNDSPSLPSASSVLSNLAPSACFCQLSSQRVLIHSTDSDYPSIILKGSKTSAYLFFSGLEYNTRKWNFGQGVAYRWILYSCVGISAVYFCRRLLSFSLFSGVECNILLYQHMFFLLFFHRSVVGLHKMGISGSKNLAGWEKSVVCAHIDFAFTVLTALTLFGYGGAGRPAPTSSG